ncbi:hypothetical protein HY623_01280 [Candidatus Uhrbacteria bacterium]|nr:hypothetical protein [Candidatus Uhrbacteria bacterium]
MPKISAVIPPKGGIQTIKMTNENNQISGLALDIDDTIVWTCREWVDVIHEEFGNPENLTKHEFYEKYRLLHNAPYIQRDDIIARVREICVDERHHENLPLIEDALPAIERIDNVIPIVTYLTARPECMRESTERWLSRHDFPKLELVMRPDDVPFGKSASSWKARALEDLYPRVFGIIDDNPSICLNLSPDYPGTIFLYRYSGDDMTHTFAVPCGDWSDVIEKVRSHYEKKRIA